MAFQFNFGVNPLQARTETEQARTETEQSRTETEQTRTETERTRRTETERSGGETPFSVGRLCNVTSKTSGLFSWFAENSHGSPIFS